MANKDRPVVRCYYADDVITEETKAKQECNAITPAQLDRFERITKPIKEYYKKNKEKKRIIRPTSGSLVYK